MKTLYCSLFLFLVFAKTSFAGVTVLSPTNGQTVNTVFPVSANAPTCSNQTVTLMGFSMDNGADETASFAGVTVLSPTNGQTVNTVFPVSANAPTCSNQTVTLMGFSMDNGADE